jgi:site-specific DNA-cytosine methylase
LIFQAPNGKDIDLNNLPDYPTQLLEVRTDEGKRSRREIRQAEGRDSTKRGKLDKKYVPKTMPVANALTTGQHNIEKWVLTPVVRVREATKKGYAEATVGDSINISVPTSKTRRGRVQKGRAGTLQTSQNQVTITEGGGIRRLTPRECERLQGFPDDWTEQGMSDTQRYKQCGNAVTVNVVQAIMEALR